MRWEQVSILHVSYTLITSISIACIIFIYPSEDVRSAWMSPRLKSVWNHIFEYDHQLHTPHYHHHQTSSASSLRRTWLRRLFLPWGESAPHSLWRKGGKLEKFLFYFRPTICQRGIYQSYALSQKNTRMLSSHFDVFQPQKKNRSAISVSLLALK